MTKRLLNSAAFLFIVSALVLYAVYRLILSFLSDKPHNAPLDASELRYDLSVYADRADAIYNAMYGLGTDESAVFSALAGMNREELIAIYNAFGSRRYDSLTGAFTSRKMDLIGFFNDEFSGPDLDRLRAIYAPTGLWK